MSEPIKEQENTKITVLEPLNSRDENGKLINGPVKRTVKHLINEKEKKLCELVICGGEPPQIAWKKVYVTDYTTKRYNNTMSKESVIEYCKILRGDTITGLIIGKNKLIEELTTRLKGAKDADAVAIIKTLNRMLGYEEPEKVDTKIEIAWKPLES